MIGGTMLLRKTLTTLIIVSIFFLTIGCQNENLQSQNGFITNDEVTENGVEYDEMSILQEASLNTLTT